MAEMQEPMSDAGWGLRLAAAKRFETLGWPTTRLEAWHWFSTRAFEDLDLTARPETKNVALPDLPSPRVVFIDGRFAPHLLSLGEHAETLFVRALSDYDDESLARVVGRLTPEDGALEHANLAFLSGGVHIVAAKNSQTPLLHIVHLTTHSGVVHARTILELESHASLTVMDHHIGLAEPDARYLHNLVTEVHLGPGSHLALGKRISESASGSHIESLIARLDRDSRFSSFSLSLTAARARTAIVVELAGAGAECSVDGLYLGQGKSILDHTTEVRHLVGHTTSSETWAGVLDDRATGTFQGVIKIAPGAAKSATRQLTRTLLLSEGAQANAKPELHIDCDDVTATHGASIGQLDPLQQFYLESRGIPRDDARRILVAAFVRQVLALAPAALIPILKTLVEARLGGETRVEDDADAPDAALTLSP